MSQALRKLTAVVAQSKTTLIFINQIRNKIGVMFGNPETTTGGLALKFYATMRLEIRRIENIKEGDVVVGARARVKVVKNKVAPPYRTAEFEMIHGFGVSREGCLVDMGVEAAIVEKVRALGTSTRANAPGPGPREREGLPQASHGRRREARRRCATSTWSPPLTPSRWRRPKRKLRSSRRAEPKTRSAKSKA